MATNIFPINPDRFALEDYSSSDLQLVSQFPSITTFNPATDYIEFFVYNLNGSLLFPVGEEPGVAIDFVPFRGYRLEDNKLVLSPEDDLAFYGFDRGVFNVYYSFLSNRCGSTNNLQYFISEISSDRTEIRLSSTSIPGSVTRLTVNDFISERNSDQYYPDFYLNFGQNQLIIANNIALDGDTVLIKLYEPLPSQYNLKSQCYIVEEVANPVAFNVQIVPEVIDEDTTIKLQGPNLNINLKDEISNSGDSQDWLSLTSTDLSSSYQQVSSYYDDPSIKINVDYTNYSNFINFSSAESRIGNFFYKLQQIEYWTSESQAGGNQSGAVTAVSSSVAFFQNKINETINQFDNFEYYLYFSSGSVPYPKSNTSLPYEQVPTTSSLAQTWITSSLISASDYDVDNVNWIYYSIPEYIREDSLNANYLAFCNMIAHFYDENVWVYIKDITKKWDNDNRIDAGISPDLIAQQLRDLGFTIYENQFSSFNLYSSLLGITPSGSTFPYPDMTGSLPTPSGYEYINAYITGSNIILPQDDVNKRLYKRIYNALPYLYKKKGTIDGIRALATIYGIPNTLLQINEFGGKDKDNTNDWDYWYERFNYKFDTNSNGFITTDWDLNTDWNSEDNVPASLEFRFKTPGLQSGIDTPNQVLWSLDTDAYITLEYTGSGYTSGSFSGSTVDPYYEYATLKLVPDFTGNPASSASIYLPFYNGNFWSVAATREGNNFYLYAANSIYSGSDGSQIGFNATSSTTVASNLWTTGDNSYFPSNARAEVNGHTAFSGSYQEIRYYNTPISYSIFEDYTMNPQSIEGNGINSGSSELAFRASLGGELYTGSVSIHPKITGSWATVNSFASDSNFTITNGTFSSNNEYVFLDQPAVGIKNRITDKIKSVGLDLPSGNQQLSNIASIQQNSIGNQAYTPNIDLLEVSLSPTNQINDDIIDSLGYLNIGEYIGDPRQAISGSFTYPDLDALRDNYFLKYKGPYDWNDFIRLIKFFDNSLFKLIKDFTPAKTSLASGITIKQHLLERQKYPVPSASYSEPEYTGSIGEIAGLLDGQRIYTASSAYESFPIETITGSQGGTLPTFVSNTNYTVDQIVNVTQSWEGSNRTPFGFQTFTDSTAQEFINGEFSGSAVLVTNGELNPGCDPFKVASTTNIIYDIYSSFNPTIQGFSNQMEYAQNPGEIFIWWKQTITSNREYGAGYFDYVYSPAAIAISKESDNGLDLDAYIPSVLNYILQAGYTSGDVTLSGWTPSYFPSYNLGNLELDVTTIQEYNTSLSGTGFYIVQLAPNPYNITVLTDNPAGTVSVATKSNVLTIFEPFVPLSFGSSDCNAVYGNEVLARQSEKFWDLDYNTNAVQAVNYETIMTASQQNGILPKAFVQDYNYYTKRSTIPRYEGSKNTVENFNTGSGFNSQYSIGTYIGFYSIISTAGNYATINVSHLITPDGEVISNTQDDQWLQLLDQNFCRNSSGEATAYTLPLSSSINPKTLTYLQALTTPGGIIYLRASGSSPYTGEYGYGGGLVYPAGLELSSANENLQTGFTILRNAGVITAGTGN